MLAARRITTWALSIGLLAAFGCDGGQNDELNDQIAKLRAEKEQLNADLTAAQDESAKAVAGIADLNEQLEALKTAEADAKKLTEQAQAELTSAKSDAEQSSAAMQAERDRTAAQAEAAAGAKADADTARAEANDLKQQVAELTGKLTDAQAALDAARKEIEALKKKPDGGQP